MTDLTGAPKTETLADQLYVLADTLENIPGLPDAAKRVGRTLAQMSDDLRDQSAAKLSQRVSGLSDDELLAEWRRVSSAADILEQGSPQGNEWIFEQLAEIRKSAEKRGLDFPTSNATKGRTATAEPKKKYSVAEINEMRELIEGFTPLDHVWHGNEQALWVEEALRTYILAGILVDELRAELHVHSARLLAEMD